ncbi:MAG TPA: type II toxin-antitoxin system VapB family antitoxin [Stellaceae bacterium]|jgi:antitoxin VapB|nr:type II toxin-antitoxin system VapB family antitoxin [Stellaceae bacterium]
MHLDLENSDVAFHVRDPATDLAVRSLAKLKGKSLTETIREAVENEYERERGKIPLLDRIKAIQDRAAALARPGGKPADKAFYDELSGEF